MNSNNQQPDQAKPSGQELAKAEPDCVEDMVFPPPARGLGSKQPADKYNRVVHQLLKGNACWLVAEQEGISQNTVLAIRHRHQDLMPDQDALRLDRIGAISDKAQEEVLKRDLSNESTKDLSVVIGVMEDKRAQAKPKLIQHQHVHAVIDEATVQNMIGSLPDGAVSDMESPDLDPSVLDIEPLTEDEA